MLRRLWIVLAMILIIVASAACGSTTNARTTPAGGQGSNQGSEPTAVTNEPATPLPGLTGEPTMAPPSATATSEATGVVVSPAVTATREQESQTPSPAATPTTAPVASPTPTATRTTAPRATASAPSPTPGVRAVPAPHVLGYDGNRFLWQWNGEQQVGQQDWYFDIQFYRVTAQDPYHVIVANPADVHVADGTWSFDRQETPLCESYWVVQIAKRTNGQFASCISPKSNRHEIGGGCGQDGEEGPPPTPCRGCG